MANNENNNKGSGGIWGVIIISIIAVVMVVILLAWATAGWVNWNPEKWFNSWGTEQTQPDDNPGGDTDKDPNTPHEHTFDTTKWLYDSKNHYHASTCGHNVVTDMYAHTFNENDTICAVCGYNSTPEQHKHTFTTKWTSDEKNHWHAATCGHNIVKDIAAHAYENGVCKVCGYKQTAEPETHKHTYDTSKWVSDGVNHWHASTCGHDIVKDVAAHTYENGACSVCGYQPQEELYNIEYDTLGAGSVKSIEVTCPKQAKIGASVTLTVDVPQENGITITRAVLLDTETGEEIKTLNLKIVQSPITVMRLREQFTMPGRGVTIMFYLGEKE